MSIARALFIANHAHLNQKDKQGVEYILHPINVMMLLNTQDTELMEIALLHDTMEDNDQIDEEYIRNCGFSERVITALKLLTHAPGIPYMDYIEAIAANPDAKAVKIADLRHNTDIRRAKPNGNNKYDLYCQAYARLTKP